MTQPSPYPFILHARVATRSQTRLAGGAPEADIITAVSGLKRGAELGRRSGKSGASAGARGDRSETSNVVTCADRMWAIFDKLRLIKSRAWNLDINRWDWSSGVGLWGVMRCHEVLGDARCLDFLVSWVEQNMAGRVKGSVNHVLPAYIVEYLWRVQGDERYRKICDEYAEWCLDQATRTDNGGLAHVWPGGQDDYRHQLWVNSTFMAGMFMLRYGAELPNEALFDDGCRQYQIHLESLYDAKIGLFFHGYHCQLRGPIGDYWGRGNGWMVASLTEGLSWLPPDHSLRESAERIFQATMQRALSLKTADGRLRVMPLVDDAYPESTCSALFGFAALRGFRRGLLPRAFLDWGLQLSKTMGDLISEDGRVANCSHSANPDSMEAYLQRPCEQSLYADGIMLAFLAEAIIAIQSSGKSAPVSAVSD
ncbi:glycoside hydrolase family 88 protein [Synoicihabitans lomoniglobus]|uniref:Glycoside hydrolase family 88 protein n=1 Tax=Synoicihabitans lomoniglobus TaxID=2909285 RepID=A0AAE9ZV41_9BACT|nr:glycoside hydrolase family 88 protein [Opitutaceae bacterium LMO-M01]WED64726.1 glycoside hydrolase family 88 protein [Opitutaceae bacterium LMO-M01]